MANGKKPNETKISPYFIALAAGLLIILLAVLLVMSGVLDHAFEGTSETSAEPVEETSVTEEPAAESATPEPTPTEKPTYQIYVTTGSGGDAYATTNTVKDGESDHITVIPDVGYAVSSISINGTLSSYYGSFDLTEVHMDTVIHIEFVSTQPAVEEPSEPAEE